MKHFNKALAAVFLAASVSMTSCVDNEVSPEVKQLRETQVAYLQAKADLEAARAQREVIENELSVSLNAIAVQNAEANLLLDLAEIDAEVKEAEADLKEQELLFEKAVLDLEVYLAGQSNTEAAKYLTEYTNAATTLNGIAGTQIQKQAALAKAQMILASPNASWVVQEVVLNGQLATENGKLTAQEAALASLEGVAADPASAIEEAKSLSVQISDLENQNIALTTEITKAGQAATAASTKKSDAESAITDYLDFQDDLEGIVENIVAAEETRSDMESNIAVQTALLASYNTNLTNSKAALTPFETISNTAKTDMDTKYNVYVIAEENLVIAQNNDAANSTPETTAAVTAATTARDEALTAYNDAVTDYNDANVDRDAAIAQVDFAQDDVDNQQSLVDNLNNNLATQIVGISNLNVSKLAKEAEIAALQAAYDDAVANLETYKIDVNVTAAASAALTAEKNANAAMVLNLTAVKSVIEVSITSINDAIGDKKTEIAGTKAAILVIEGQLADQAISMADQEKEVAALEAELAKLESEIAAQEALVNKWKALLDAALAG